ncbi:protein MAIN-LIKE 1-like [Rhododendron vialii]|uniref:protein MAIN-LIKE 1-like n=1 Tax=Rhododendron vialii TaxID=182163 RepID=UPI00265D977B|nr:protein MAIN-LIKE 1-like [Rhododendron vialii]
MNSGLLPLCSINKNSQCNSFRISAFIERWHPETNTFHFDFGEMGLTLDDVEHLLGILVRGLPVYTEDERTPKELLMDLLGVSKEVATNAITANAVKRYAVKLSWLEMTFKEVNETNTDERVVCCARAYLLYVIGRTLFCDKSGGFVQLDLLPLLEDLDQVHTYGWGSSCLAYLYRNLGYASRRKAKQMGGFLILLEAWINEHFPTLLVVVDPEYMEELPRARRWCLHSESGTSVQHYWRVLDNLLVDEVIFYPYKDRRQNVSEIAFYTGPIRAMSYVEPYLPDRVLRQFGLLQRIPADPIAPQRASRGQHTYTVVYEWTEGFWSSPNYHLVPEDKKERTPPGIPWACTDDYIPWLRRERDVVWHLVEGVLGRVARSRFGMCWMWYRGLWAIPDLELLSCNRHCRT